MSSGPLTNLTYIGQGPASAGQFIADQTSGAKSKTLYATGVITNGNTTTAATNSPIGFIDGIQSVQQQVTIPVLSVTAAATIGGTANQAVYSGVGAYGQLAVGQSITFAGFSNSGNNGTFTINALTTSTIQVTNSSSVAETNPQASLLWNKGAIPIAVDVYIAGTAADTLAAVTAAMATPGVFPTALSGTGFTINYSAFATTAQTVHFGAVVTFAS